jgi:predicted O-methyltransferase YrrM
MTLMVCGLFLAKFLEARRKPVATDSAHAPVTIGFRIQGSAGTTRFAVSLNGSEAILCTSGEPQVDRDVACTQEEFEALLAGRSELLGPFWDRHLPPDYSFAPSLYAFLFPDHPYRDLNPVLRDLYQTSRYYPSITPFPQGHTLHCIVLEHRLDLTLEIGLAFGGSALFICNAHQRKGTGHHYAIDPFQIDSFDGVGQALIRKAGLGAYLQWLPTPAQTALPALRTTGMTFDLIYIDGDHGVTAVLSDFLHANALLKTGGFLALDDSHFPSGVRALQVIRRHFPYQAVTDRSTDRLTVLRKMSHADGPAALRMMTAVRRVSSLAFRHHGKRHHVASATSTYPT